MLKTIETQYGILELRTLGKKELDSLGERPDLKTYIEEIGNIFSHCWQALTILTMVQKFTLPARKIYRPVTEFIQPLRMQFSSLKLLIVCQFSFGLKKFPSSVSYIPVGREPEMVSQISASNS